MTTGSRILLYLLVGGPAVVVAVYLLLLGPLGWFTAAFLVLAGMAFFARRDGDDDNLPERTNCGTCGSPNPVDADDCGYCGDPI